MEISYILTGGNLGDRHTNLSRAADLLDSRAGRILRRSSLYETAARGIESQPDFLNQVLEIETALDPEALLSLLLEIEREMGRIRGEKFGPRTIDLDIIIWDRRVVHDDFYGKDYTTIPVRELLDRHGIQLHSSEAIEQVS